MYDFDIHARFVSSAMDAWFNYATALVAACGACQDHISSQLDSSPPSKPEPPASPYEQAFSWWSNMFMPQGQVKPSAADFGAGFFQFSPLHNMHKMPGGFDPMAMFNPFMAFAPGPAQQASTAWSSNWMDMMTAYSRAMPQFSWSIFQGPMTAWLMSVGLPYSVAAPTAKGNAASMDAAVAAREGFDKMYASFRTDGGHAVAPILSMQPMALFLAPYWTASNSVH